MKDDKRKDDDIERFKWIEYSGDGLLESIKYVIHKFLMNMY